MNLSYEQDVSGMLTRVASARGRREEQKAQNRAKLLLAARKVFAAKGLGEATARDITRETDLASGTFYNYFTDKEDAFRALMQELAESSRALVREQRSVPGLTLEQRIAAGYRAYFEWVVLERELFQVFRRNAGAIAMMPDGELFDAGIAELLEDMGEWEELRGLPERGLEYLATSAVGMGFQIATHLVDGEPPDVDGATDFCTKMFMGGVRALAE
jgi:AcrR family transcriptional regulator